ncbi:hypothetical protein TSUD_406310 [Trifolium subterraneum]|uniref:Reverse transcriptase zinc-binding domain-containing protein n=1 Tax=Trifolium subterraneum TaxID=3900 RepID=A0A2Z6NXB5_TRISU|nr:hypothetical protein TSUD_406310 [Trifolium subterraneum]
MEEQNLFTGYSAGETTPLSVSHLQFADDTLLLWTKSWDNVRALRAVLVLFETMSGLKAFEFLGTGFDSFEESFIGMAESFSFFWRSSGSAKVREFNLALLEKWCWRMFVDREGFWLRVLAARYGVERVRLCAGGSRGSAWSRELVSIRDGGGDLEGGWFRRHILRKVGDGANTFFWTDPWMVRTPLSERFGRLFDLAVNKSVSVAEMFQSGWEVGGEAWVWRRPLRAWEEEMLGECQTLLLTVSLQAFSYDRWLWQPYLDGGYSVCGAYQILTAHDVVPLDAAADLIWHTQVPLKVSIFAWRLLRDRLPTKVNLISRGILPMEDHLCVSGCGAVESAQHVFLSCSTFRPLWNMVNSCICSSLATAQTPSDHFVQFTTSAGGTRGCRSFMQLIWLACV